MLSKHHVGSATRTTNDPSREMGSPRVENVDLTGSESVVSVRLPTEFANGDLIAPSGRAANLIVVAKTAKIGEPNPFAFLSDEHTAIAFFVSVRDQGTNQDGSTFRSRVFEVAPGQWGHVVNVRFPAVEDGHSLFAACCLESFDRHAPPASGTGQMVDTTPITPPPPPAKDPHWKPPSEFKNERFWLDRIPEEIPDGDTHTITEAPVRVTIEHVPGANIRTKDPVKYPPDIYEGEAGLGLRGGGVPYYMVRVFGDGVDGEINRNPVVVDNEGDLDWLYGQLRLKSADYLAFFFDQGMWYTANGPKIPASS